jgi:AraC-like DNA-binding protein
MPDGALRLGAPGSDSSAKDRCEASLGLIQPSVDDTRSAQTWSAPLSGAVVWFTEVTQPREEFLLPDLSIDAVLRDGRVAFLPRTIAAQTVALQGGVSGLRLPISSVDLTLNPQWPGWRQRPRSLDSAATLWRDAIRAGAVSWRVDQGRESLLGELDRPQARTGHAAMQVSMSERTLRRRSLLWFGMTPVQVSANLRFWRLLRAITDGNSFTASAHSSGFSDASHAAREVRRITGLPASAMRDWKMADFFTTA